MPQVVEFEVNYITFFQNCVKRFSDIQVGLRRNDSSEAIPEPTGCFAKENSTNIAQTPKTANTSEIGESPNSLKELELVH